MPDPLQMSHACRRFWTCYKTITFCSVLARCIIPCACQAEPSKSAPNLSVFCTFDFEMCFAPQRRALFRRLNFQKWSEPGVFRTFWLPNVLRATMACNFSSRIWPHGSAPAALASLCFDPPEPQIIRKNTVNRDFATFAHLHLLSSDSFSSLIFSSLLWLFPPLLIHLAILSEVWPLNFLWSVTISIYGFRVHSADRESSAIFSPKAAKDQSRVHSADREGPRLGFYQSASAWIWTCCVWLTDVNR